MEAAEARPVGCTTADPFVSLGGGTCWNGGWFPPGDGCALDADRTADDTDYSDDPDYSRQPTGDGSCAASDPVLRHRRGHLQPGRLEAEGRSRSLRKIAPQTF